MKDAFENSFKENLDNFELPYDASAWSAMQAKLDATSAAGSNNFDQKVKESLSGNEYPYNPAAWTAMSKKLDAKKGGKGKWYIAASILAVVSVAGYLLMTADTEQTKDQNAQNTVQTSKANSTKTNNSNNKSSNSTTNSTSIVDPSNLSQQNTANGSNNNSQRTQNANTPADQNVIPNNSNEPNNSGTGGDHRNSGNSQGNPTTVTANNHSTQIAEKKWDYISPKIENICFGTISKIKNDNDYPLVIINPNGQVWTSAENTQTPFNPAVDGTHRVGYMKKNRFIEQESFTVNPSPKADFEFVDLSKIFLDGLPTTEVRTSSTGKTFTWNYENGTEYGTEAELHFYKKGVHVIELTVEGATGCESTVTKTVNIDENYNLMANTGFYPMGIDPRTNVFMPYSLTKRDVQFTMIILDPNDGHLIYETSDASKGWDGVDRQTGSLVQMEKVYIWKVNLNNPEKGESSEYAGTIMPLAK